MRARKTSLFLSKRLKRTFSEQDEWQRSDLRRRLNRIVTMPRERDALNSNDRRV